MVSKILKIGNLKVESSGVRLEKWIFGVIRKKVGPLLDRMAHRAKRESDISISI